MPITDFFPTPEPINYEFEFYFENQDSIYLTFDTNKIDAVSPELGCTIKEWIELEDFFDFNKVISTEVKKIK